MLRGTEEKCTDEKMTQGLSISITAAHTGFNRRTIRKYLTNPATPRYPRRAPRPTRLDPYRAFIEPRLQAGGGEPPRPLPRFSPPGYNGGRPPLNDSPTRRPGSGQQ